MALDIAGIGNVGEFFSQHYLDALLEKDLKDTLSRWAKRKAEDKVPAPQDRLARLADPYFRLTARAEGVTDASERLALSEDFHANLLGALGYERKPSTALLDDDRILPVLYTELQNQKPWLWIVEAPFPASDDEADPFVSRLCQGRSFTWTGWPVDGHHPSWQANRGVAVRRTIFRRKNRRAGEYSWRQRRVPARPRQVAQGKYCTFSSAPARSARAKVDPGHAALHRGPAARGRASLRKS